MSEPRTITDWSSLPPVVIADLALPLCLREGRITPAEANSVLVLGLEEKEIGISWGGDMDILKVDERSSFFSDGDEPVIEFHYGSGVLLKCDSPDGMLVIGIDHYGIIELPEESFWYESPGQKGFFEGHFPVRICVGAGQPKPLEIPEEV